MNPTINSIRSVSSCTSTLRGIARRAAATLATAVVGVLALPATSAFAQAVYTYTGNPFTLFSCGPSVDPNTGAVTGTLDCSTPAPTNPNTSYVVTDRVTATLTFTNLLPASMPLTEISGLAGFQLTMNDGQHTVAYGDAVGRITKVATDASGQITQWQLVLNTGGTANGGIDTINFGTNIVDIGVLACCDPTVQGNLALNLSMPGTWSSGAPSPATLTTNLIGTVSNPLLGLTSGQVNSLTDKLNNALASIQAGLNKQAINQLNAFVSSVQTYLKNGKVSTQTATTLTNAANAIIAALQ